MRELHQGWDPKSWTNPWLITKWFTHIGGLRESLIKQEGTREEGLILKDKVHPVEICQLTASFPEYIPQPAPASAKRENWSFHHGAV